MEIPVQSAAPRRVRVAAYLDATEEHFEPHAVSRVDAFEKAVSSAPNLDIQAHVVRNGTSAGRKLIKGLAYLAMQVAPPVAGQVLFGTPGLIVGGLITGYLAYQGFSLEAAKNLGGAAHQPFTMPGPHWTGTRLYQITQDRSDGIDSTLLDQSDQKRPATPAELGGFFGSRFQEGDTNIAYVAGHGWGPWKVASMLTRDFAAAMDKAGTQPDVVVFESCLMGNLEALSLLRGKARVAVVSEELMVAGGLGGGHLPIRAMLAGAARQGGTPQEIGQRMVEQAGRAGVPTLAAIDLDQLDTVFSKLGELSERLLALPPEKKQALRQALHESLPVPASDHQLGGKADFSDLGDFLTRVGKVDPGAAAVREALDRAVIARTATSENASTTGLSFCSVVPKGGEPIYAGLPIPESYRKLMLELMGA